MSEENTGNINVEQNLLLAGESGKSRRWLILEEPNESQNTNSSCTKCQRPCQRADERVEVRATSCPQDGKLSLKVNEP